MSFYDESKTVRALAEDVIKTFDIQAPIKDFEKAVEKLGGKFVVVDDKYGVPSASILTSFDTYPRIEKKETGFTLYVFHQIYHTKEYRFKMAASVGRLFLNMGYQINSEIWDSFEYDAPYDVYHETIKQTMMANMFAYTFMMPEKIFKSIVEEYTIDGMVNTAEIADVFGVTTNAVDTRGIQLKMWKPRY